MDDKTLYNEPDYSDECDDINIGCDDNDEQPPSQHEKGEGEEKEVAKMSLLPVESPLVSKRAHAKAFDGEESSSQPKRRRIVKKQGENLVNYENNVYRVLAAIGSLTQNLYQCEEKIHQYLSKIPEMTPTDNSFCVTSRDILSTANEELSLLLSKMKFMSSASLVSRTSCLIPSTMLSSATTTLHHEDHREASEMTKIILPSSRLSQETSKPAAIETKVSNPVSKEVAILERKQDTIIDVIADEPILSTESTIFHVKETNVRLTSASPSPRRKSPLPFRVQRKSFTEDVSNGRDDRQMELCDNINVRVTSDGGAFNSVDRRVIDRSYDNNNTRGRKPFINNNPQRWNNERENTSSSYHKNFHNNETSDFYPRGGRGGRGGGRGGRNDDIADGDQYYQQKRQFQQQQHQKRPYQGDNWKAAAGPTSYDHYAPGDMREYRNDANVDEEYQGTSMLDRALPDDNHNGRGQQQQQQQHYNHHNTRGDNDNRGRGGYGKRRVTNQY